MADRGFDVGDVLQHRGVTLNIPHFLEDRRQLTSWEVEETKRIAPLRIHIEHAIGRVKNYQILQVPFPITLANLASDIVIVSARMTDFCKPIVRVDE